TYVIAFRQPIPAGMRATVTLGLSAEPGLNATVQRIDFTTSEIFQPIFLGCAEKRVPVSGAGNSYGKDAALSCKTESEQIAGTRNNRPRHEEAEGSSEGEENQGDSAEGDGEGGDQETTGDQTEADTGDAEPVATGPEPVVDS